MAYDEYLNLKEAARYLGVSDIKIRHLVNDGLLKVSLDPLDDRKRLVKKADLDSLKTPRPATSLNKLKGRKSNETSKNNQENAT